MKFTFIVVNTVAKTTVTEISIPAGSQICGLVQSQQRPQTVTLTYEELRYLLRNHDYAVSQVLTSLAPSKG